MNTEQQIGDDPEDHDGDRLDTINQQLAETELALRRTLEFFDRVGESKIATRLGASNIRERLLTDLEKLEQEQIRSDPPGK